MGGSSISHPLSLLRCSQPVRAQGFNPAKTCASWSLIAPPSPQFRVFVLLRIHFTSSQYVWYLSITRHHCPKYQDVTQLSLLNVNRLSSGDFQPRLHEVEEEEEKNIASCWKCISDVIQFDFGVLCHHRSRSEKSVSAAEMESIKTNTHTHTYWGKEKVKQTHQLCATKHTKTARWSNGSQLPMVLCRKDEWSWTWRGRQWKHTCTRAHARFICILIMRRDSYITMCTAQRREAARFNWRQHECVCALLCIKRNHKLVRYFIHVAHSEWGDKWGDRRREEQGIKRRGDKEEGKVVRVLVDWLGSFLHLRCDDPIELKVNLEKIWALSLFIYLFITPGKRWFASRIHIQTHGGGYHYHTNYGIKWLTVGGLRVVEAY